jgi:hypothetical protein
LGLISTEGLFLGVARERRPCGLIGTDALNRVDRRALRRRTPQTVGGPRALKEERDGYARAKAIGASSLSISIVSGNGNAGATDGTDVAANWINAQIGQSKSGDPFDL